MFFEVYEDKAGEFRWRLKSRNGQIVGTSGEGYTRRYSVYRAIDRIVMSICCAGTTYKVRDLTV